MNPRVLAILLGVVVLLAAGVFVANQTGAGDTSGGLTFTPVPTQPLVLGTEKPIERVEVTHQGKRAAVHKEGDKWVLAEPPSPEADQFRISGLVAQLGRLRPARTLPGSGDLVPFGLAIPETDVKITFQGGETQTLLIGNQGPTQQGYYAKLANSDGIFLLDSPIVTDLRRMVTDPPVPKPTATPTIVGPVLVTPVASGTPAAGATAQSTPVPATPAATATP
jgi:hypothetical protein